MLDASHTDVTLHRAGLVVDSASILEAINAGEVPDALLRQAHLSETLLAGLDILDDEFAGWLMEQRQVLHRRLATALIEGFSRENVANSVRRRMAEAMLLLDRANEEACRIVMRCAAEEGDVPAALRVYDALYRILGDEHDMEPAAETQELLARIKLGHFERRRLTDPDPGGSGPPRLAVLPFHQIDGNPIGNHLTQGLVADIVSQLAGLRELSVISHGSTSGLNDPALDSRAAARMLGARYLVSGSIRRQADDVRLNCELADAENGAVVWTRTHDLNGTLNFNDQDQVVAQIVNTLAPRVRELELRRIRGKRPESLTVYEKTLLVREHLATLRREEFEGARRLLDEVIAEEPTYAEAYALDADWHGLFISQGWSSDRAGHIAAVERQTRQALALDGDNVRALVFFAHRRSLHHRDFAAARELFARALDVSPSSAKAWLWSSLTYSYLAETDEALRRAKRALSLSPRDREAHQFYAALNIAYYTAGDYAPAVEWGLKALAEPATMRATYRWTAASLVGHGDLARAREIARCGIEQMPGQRVRDAVANSAYADTKRREAYGKHLLAAGFPP
jgi:TolB-like protein/Tfp pilus assembly protein PilF